MNRKKEPSLPDKPTLDGLEAKWVHAWETNGTYRFDRTKTREDVFSIDTPPPTVSGALHIGHCFSYTHTDLIARFQRMSGKEVFYPMGWDDNGLNTERRVQLMLGIKCDPSLPYDPNFAPPSKPDDKKLVPVSRRNFVDQCKVITEQLEEAYHHLWATLGLSVDWTLKYETIGERARKVSQQAFLRLLSQGLAYNADSPVMWDVDMHTAVAQAEMEDRETAGAYHRIAFKRADGGPDVLIDTTRPELIAADIAVAVNPNDERFKDLIGKELLSPLFNAPLPVFAHELAEIEKGTGAVMVSTWGDLTDVIWWREFGLEARVILDEHGRLKPIKWGEGVFTSKEPAAAQAVYDQLVGLNSKRAQKVMVELLRESGQLVDEPKTITHPVKFWENGKQPLELIPKRQWYINVLENKDRFMKRGAELKWHPDYMKVRLDNWINGLNQEWGVSRQRFFGVAIPIWYPLDENGNPQYNRPLTPDESRLPIDPTSDLPDGYTEAQRNQPNGFTADPDILDTWATSSLTPQIAAGWEEDPDLFERVFPMDMRPQAHEIIRTWLFYTLVRAEYENNSLPFKNAAISGFVVDPDRKKISKSKGNAQDQPIDLITQYGSDAVRYWAANAAPGLDCPLDHNQFKIGRRLATKMLNASKFVLGLGLSNEPLEAVTVAIDKAMLAELSNVISESTKAFQDFNYAKALDRTEAFFWNWCDNYLELAKPRAYGNLGDEKAESAKAALAIGLSVMQRLLAPFLCYTAEEVWSWWQEGSVHRAPWPQTPEFATALPGSNPELLRIAIATLAEVRKAKTEAQQSMKAVASEVIVSASAAELDLLRDAEDDLRESGVIEKLGYEEGPFAVRVVLAEQTSV